jgi:hypothetical protein
MGSTNEDMFSGRRCMAKSNEQPSEQVVPGEIDGNMELAWGSVDDVLDDERRDQALGCK